MKKKTWILAMCIAVGIIALLMATAAATSMMGYGVSVGKLYFTEESTFLIDGTSSMIVSDQSRKSDLFDGYANGDEIILVHDGMEEICSLFIRNNYKKMDKSFQYIVVSASYFTIIASSKK